MGFVDIDRFLVSSKFISIQIHKTPENDDQPLNN